jgi:MFS family permease
MSLWFAASAVAPQYQTRWDLAPAQTAWLTTSVQLGFVAGTAVSALLNLADVVPARRLFAVSAVAGAAANALLVALPADRAAAYPLALACRAATGVCLAGVYPPAMKMVATWFRARRGLAVGTVVGALTVGKATPYLVHALPGAGISPVVLTASAAALAAAALVAHGLPRGAVSRSRRVPFAWGLVGSIVRERRWRLPPGGYLGHMWELYAAWTWLPAFLAASIAARHPGATGTAAAEHARAASAVSFAVLAVGGLGCVWGGLAADRPGPRLARHPRPRGERRVRPARGLHVRWPGRAHRGGGPRLGRVGDRRQRSVLGARHRERTAHAVGTALTLQTSLGFLLTAASIQLVPPLAAAAGWRWAFPVLALGPAAGLWCVGRLVRATARATAAPRMPARQPAAS